MNWQNGTVLLLHQPSKPMTATATGKVIAGNDDNGIGNSIWCRWFMLHDEIKSMSALLFGFFFVLHSFHGHFELNFKQIMSVYSSNAFSSRWKFLRIKMKIMFIWNLLSSHFNFSHWICQCFWFFSFELVAFSYAQIRLRIEARVNIWWKIFTRPCLYPYIFH